MGMLPAMTDEQAERVLDEERTRKHGSRNTTDFGSMGVSAIMPEKLLAIVESRAEESDSEA